MRSSNRNPGASDSHSTGGRSHTTRRGYGRLDGDLEAAEQSATEALTLGTAAGYPDDAALIHGGQLFVVRWMQGRLHVRRLRGSSRLGTPTLRPQIVHANRAFAKSFDDAENEVRKLLDTEVANDFPMFADSTWLVVHLLWAGAAARTGHRPASTALYERLLPWHDQFGTTHTSVYGGVAHYLGLLAHTLDRHNEADQWFGQALALHEAMEAPFFVAMTQTAWAELLADRNKPGDTRRASDLLATAVQVARGRGYGNVARDARSVRERVA
jgi:hypothetical protein